MARLVINSKHLTTNQEEHYAHHWVHGHTEYVHQDKTKLDVADGHT
jgi:hypothetical protein